MASRASEMSVEPTVAWLMTARVVFPAIRAMSTDAPIAARSATDGLQGIRIRSAARAAASAASLACGAVSMIASCAPALRAALRTGSSLGDLGSDDGGRGGLTAVRPGGGGGLRVDVDEGGGKSGSLRRSRECARQGGLPRSALHCEARDGKHVRMLAFFVGVFLRLPNSAR